MIKKLWRWLFGGHDHKWKILYEVPYKIRDSDDNRILVGGTNYHMQCEHCGAMRFENSRVTAW